MVESREVPPREKIELRILFSERALTPELSAEHHLYFRCTLEVLVPGAVGQVGREPYAPTELFGRTYAYLEAGALQSVEADRFGVGTYADVFGIVIAADDGVENRVNVFVEGNLLDRIDHSVDGLLLLREGVGTQ